jgi:hypothetical protein
LNGNYNLLIPFICDSSMVLFPCSTFRLSVSLISAVLAESNILALDIFVGMLIYL